MSPPPVPAWSAADVPWVSVAQMREVDRRMIDDRGITLVRMMENAGRALAALCRHLLEGDLRGRSIVVLAGPGGNGGGGLVAARHLLNAGASVTTHLAARELSFVTNAQANILKAMDVPPEHGATGLPPADLAIDALLGYSGSGAPRDEFARLIRAAEGARIVALDVPSGLDLSDGSGHEPGVRAEATLTLAAPKTGLRRQAARTGRLFLADISVPAGIWDEIGERRVPPFSRGPLVELSEAGSR